MDKPPHLTLVTPTHTQSEHDQEFTPLPFYGWAERPSTLPLDPDECATAIHIAEGDLPKASALLKVPQFKLEREVRRHPNLTRILNEELQIAVLQIAKRASDRSRQPQRAPPRMGRLKDSRLPYCSERSVRAGARPALGPGRQPQLDLLRRRPHADFPLAHRRG